MARTCQAGARPEVRTAVISDAWQACLEKKRGILQWAMYCCVDTAAPQQNPKQTNSQARMIMTGIAQLPCLIVTSQTHSSPPPPPPPPPNRYCKHHSQQSVRSLLQPHGFTETSHSDETWCCACLQGAASSMAVHADDSLSTFACRTLFLQMLCPVKAQSHAPHSLAGEGQARCHQACMTRPFLHAPNKG